MTVGLSNKKIWVAGETGMVGRAIVRQLHNEDVHVLSAPHALLDLTDQQKTYDWLQVHKPDFVIMAAAKVGGIGANIRDPAGFLYQNIAMSQNVIHGAYLAGVKNLLYLGSSCIYPKVVKQPIKEDTLLSGVLEKSNEGYALAKITGVKLCAYYRQAYKVNYMSAMSTNLYGPYDRFDPDLSHVVPSIMLKMHRAKKANKQTVELWGTGNPLREFLYVDDLATAILFLLKNSYHVDWINIGSGEEISIFNLAVLIKEIVGFQGEVIFNDCHPDGVLRKHLDSKKIETMGWRASTPLKVGLSKTYQWYLENIIKA